MADESAGTPPAAVEQGQQESATPAAATPESAAPQPIANGGAQPGGKTFTQEEVNAFVAQRVKDEQRKAQERADKARLEAEGKFKELYEQAQAKLTEAENARKALELQALRRQVADKVQLPAALVDRLRGETEADIEADAKALIAALPKPTAPNINATGGGAATNGALWDEAERKRLAAIYRVSPKNFGTAGD